VFLQPDNIGPYASSDRIWSGNFWILYALLLITVHLHAGVGIYRLAMKWAPVSAASSGRTRRRFKLGMWGIIGFFLCLGTASLITYMKIGYDHAPHAGERYTPTTAPNKAGSE
jgi:fumarate reductase subunit C